MWVYPLEDPVIVDRWVRSQSWPTQSSVWFESQPHRHHRSHHRKELASPPVHWPPTHTHAHTHSVKSCCSARNVPTRWLTHNTKTEKVSNQDKINKVITAAHKEAKCKIPSEFSIQILAASLSFYRSPNK